jgi:hypothetical protein
MIVCQAIYPCYLHADISFNSYYTVEPGKLEIQQNKKVSLIMKNLYN